MKAVIYMIICLSFCSELIHCSCLSYGHSCWGAHGKRSSHNRIDSENSEQPDRWAMFKLVQDESDRLFGRDRLPVDDSLDYNDRRIPNSMKNIFRSRNSPLVLLDSFDDTILPQDMQKVYVTPNSRKRRSNAYGQNVDKPNGFLTTEKSPYDLLPSTQNQLLQQN